MLTVLLRLFTAIVDAAPGLPHRFCYLNNWWIIGTVGLADFLIGLSYVVIAAILYRIVRTLDLDWSWMLWCYGTFILLCGLGHWVDDVTLVVGWYWLTATIRLGTAVASVGTAWATWIVFQRLRHWARHAETAGA